MENNKQNKWFKAAILAIITIFATLFYIEYARSNRYLVVGIDDTSVVFDTRDECFMYPWGGEMVVVK